MSFKPKTRQAIDYYAAMPPKQRLGDIKAMAEVRRHLDHCIAAARRAEWESKRERK